MFIDFFLKLRAAGVPVSLREFLTLQQAMQAGLAEYDVEHFYFLSRSALVKDERHLDRFDQVFGQCFKGLEPPPGAAAPEAVATVALPEEWLRKLAENMLTAEEKAQIEALGGWDKLMETLKQRLAEQRGRHEGGSKWIGTAGTSPFGANGYNPEGVRIGQDKNRNRRAVKIWDKREFRNLSDNVELGTRNIKVALRRLRRFAREGAASELDLPGTIGATAKNAGYLDLKLVPERHNAVKVLLCLDVGGSMDDHVKLCEELFSATRTEFKHLQQFYFHNCPYDMMWKNARFHAADCVSVGEILNTYDQSWKLIFVGDASMSPYELIQPGGAIDSWNLEPGQIWLRRLLSAYPRAVWLNPVAQQYWGGTTTIGLVDQLMEGRMFPLTLEGLDRAMQRLMH
jgi:uncharacterized protein with von Willebrand factor type A (vWA) domain